jgi:hypothetical protein
VIAARRDFSITSPHSEKFWSPLTPQRRVTALKTMLDQRHLLYRYDALWFRVVIRRFGVPFTIDVPPS